MIIEQTQDAEPWAKVVISRIVVATALIVVVVLVGLLLPALQSARMPSRRNISRYRLKQIGLALLNYEISYGSLPPAYTVDGNGNRLHSWRTLILPYLEQHALYEKIDLTKAWDDPANAAYHNMRIDVFECPSSGVAPGSSNYLVVVDPSGIFHGSNFCNLTDVHDGTDNTLLVVEVDKSLSVPWMSPSDIDMQTYLDAQFKSQHEGGAHCCFADGSCWFMKSSLDRASMRALVTKSAGDKLNNAFP